MTSPYYNLHNLLNHYPRPFNALYKLLDYTNLLLHHAGFISIESKSLTADELLLQLLLPLPAPVLDGQTYIGGVRSCGVREDPGGRVADGEAELLSLLESVLADEVHVLWLVCLGRHLDLIRQSFVCSFRY